MSVTVQLYASTHMFVCVGVCADEWIVTLMWSVHGIFLRGVSENEESGCHQSILPCGGFTVW